MPTMSATGTVFPGAAPMRNASFTSPIPIPAGYASAAARRNPEAPTAAIVQRGLGWSAVFAARTTTLAGTTIRFGMIRCSTSTAETATSVRHTKAATNASAESPKRRKLAATSTPLTSSTARYRNPIGVPHARQRPRRTSHETSGMLSYHASSCAQLMHADGGLTSERRSGSRAATTFRKLPTARPGANASAASARSTGSARGVDGRRDRRLRVLRDPRRPRRHHGARVRVHRAARRPPHARVVAVEDDLPGHGGPLDPRGRVEVERLCRVDAALEERVDELDPVARADEATLRGRAACPAVAVGDEEVPVEPRPPGSGEPAGRLGAGRIEILPADLRVLEQDRARCVERAVAAVRERRQRGVRDVRAAVDVDGAEDQQLLGRRVPLELAEAVRAAARVAVAAAAVLRADDAVVRGRRRQIDRRRDAVVAGRARH